MHGLTCQNCLWISIVWFVLQIYHTLAKEYISHHPTMGNGHPNCSSHSQDVFENGVINAGSWKERKGSMIVSKAVTLY
jgi:hypothetical protein